MSGCHHFQGLGAKVFSLQVRRGPEHVLPAFATVANMTAGRPRHR